MKKANESLMTWVPLCWSGEGDRTDKAVRGDGGGLGAGDESWEVERDEKEVNGVGDADGDEEDDLEVQLDQGRLIPLRVDCATHNNQVHLRADECECLLWGMKGRVRETVGDNRVRWK